MTPEAYLFIGQNQVLKTCLFTLDSVFLNIVPSEATQSKPDPHPSPHLWDFLSQRL